MAEYINREKTQAYLYTNMMWYDEDGYIADDSEKDKALWSLVNGIPTADVIERSKIDKAVKEITQYGAIEKEIGNKEVANAILDVLKILQECIGE